MVVSFLDFLFDIYILDWVMEKLKIHKHGQEQMGGSAGGNQPRIKGPGKGKDKKDKKILEHNNCIIPLNTLQ